MADSPLYTNVTSALSAGMVARWESLMATMAGLYPPDHPNRAGEEVVRMIRTENHLSEAPDEPDPAPMQDVIEALCAESWPSEPQEFVLAYEALLQANFALKAPEINTSPSTIYRYYAHSGIFTEMEKDLDKSHQYALAQALGKRIADARAGKPTSSWQGVLDFAKEHLWDELNLPEIPLTGAQGSMFVTFDGSTPFPRDSAARMHSALALWKPLQECFVECKYPREGGDVLRFPTFADAGWFRYFYSADVHADHGSTQPHHATEAPQPEAVEEPQTMGRLHDTDDMRMLPP